MKFTAIIYDFDGVICNSVDVKTEAFVELYSNEGNHIQDLVRQYHINHGGISRFEKFRYYESVLLGREVTEERIAELAQQFSVLVKEKVISSEYINGAYDFLKNGSRMARQFICTGTPENEIIEIAVKKGISDYFTGIYGSPESKKNIVRKILSKTGINIDQFVFFGDAITDMEAANEFGMKFIGIRNKDTRFPPQVPQIYDFNDPLLLTYLNEQ